LLYNDDLVLGRERGREFVKRVVSGVGCSRIDSRQLPPGLSPALRCGFAADESTVQPTELAELVFESMRIGDRDSGRQHRKTPDADVQGPRHLDVLTCSTLLQAGVD
jgi:hypothetical protein